ncbi:MAG: response regulator transcription factor [Paracoccaceae bacterium]|nr:response regulator transcription factor [Paracoccaceae bacterium]
MAKDELGIGRRVRSILVIEDDRATSRMVNDGLTARGYNVYTAENTTLGEILLLQIQPDIVLLDVQLPGESGLVFARRIRAEHPTPVIMLTAMAEVHSRVSGLEAGADDYLPKPFEFSELVARIEAVLRRATEPSQNRLSTEMVFDGWVLDLLKRTLISASGVNVSLTSAEFDVISTLCLNAGTVLSRGRLSQIALGREAGPLDRSIDTLVSRIRRKIEGEACSPAIIRTVRNGGYVLMCYPTRPRPLSEFPPF